MSDTAYFYGYSDPLDKYCWYPPQEFDSSKDNWLISNKRTLQKMIDEEYNIDKPLPVNANATGFKL